MSEIMVEACQAPVNKVTGSTSLDCLRETPHCASHEQGIDMAPARRAEIFSDW